ncbi:hypothetical protein D3C71_1499930 [compost metagenome]
MITDLFYFLCNKLIRLEHLFEVAYQFLCFLRLSVQGPSLPIKVEIEQAYTYKRTEEIKAVYCSFNPSGHWDLNIKACNFQPHSGDNND